MATLYEMEQELQRLVDRRKVEVGIDLKRTNIAIATLQGKIFHAERANR